jgi:agmatinase
MYTFAAFATLSVVVTAVFGHDVHEDSQVPLGYVKYPWQATVPGDGDGKSFG